MSVIKNFHIVILVYLIPILSFAQKFEDSPLPKSSKEKCLKSKARINVSNGAFYRKYEGDSIPLDTFYFCEIDSIRVAYNGNSILRPLIENGILNGQFLMRAGLHANRYSDIALEMQMTFIKPNGETDDWEGLYISFSETELEKRKKDNVRVFRLRSSSSENISFFYLELTNPLANKMTPSIEFIKNASVSCLVLWYYEI